MSWVRPHFPALSPTDFQTVGKFVFENRIKVFTTWEPKDNDLAELKRDITWKLVLNVVVARLGVAIFNYYALGVLFGSFYEGVIVNPFVYSIFLFAKISGG